ncbi:hypothetical protein QJS10_CPB20g00086 [Acorus calamus]|uniref:GOST seven transmembrane domain-containing protein n=1 Tax=Acorus calamus TaxID=4465 RepID=A0AAV9CDJ1_ACOCL|nr:hypothetical protein QJS10_CPB20g00086 [Acorus calamus]
MRELRFRFDRLLLLWFLILLDRPIGTLSSIHEYYNQGFAPLSESFFFHGGSEGLYASQVHGTPNASEAKAPVKGRSFIRFESVIFRRTKESAAQQNNMHPKTGLVEAIIVEIKDRDKIGGGSLDSDAICCTSELAHENSCKLGEFMRHWRDILQLHYHITAVVALGMCEMAFWYFEYANFNSTGSRPMGITIWAVTFTAIKKTLSRLLLLVVSMGYGVVRPTLGGITSKVALLGVIYFVASEALELIEHLGNINDFSGKAKLFLVLPVALLDACFILWIFSSLSKTLEKLQIRRSMAKLELYRKFTNSLAISVLLSVAWIGYELYFNATDPLSELWRRAWIIPAFWNVLSYLLLLVICILWAPSNNPTRYAYSEDTGDDFDEEGVPLTGSSTKASGDMLSKLERKEKKTISSTDHVFGLGEDLEEDKRE